MKRLLTAAASLSIAAVMSAAAKQASPVATVRSGDGRVEIHLRRIPTGAREWEAFLSLDGGRSFPLRITPHLDASVAFFSWSVPGLVGEDARIRLRFGDEREESQVDLLGSIRLDPSLHSRLALPKIGDFGKKPFPGEEGLAGWVEGTSDGEYLRFVAPPPLCALEPAVGRGWGLRQEALLDRRSLDLPPPERFARRDSRANPDRTPAAGGPSDAVSPLQKTSRLNI